MITLVIGIDGKTLPQLLRTHLTWKLVRPELWEWPWIVFYDPAHISSGEVFHLRNLLHVPDISFVPWDKSHYHSQREKMVTGHVYVPAEHCRTKWFCKIDTDTMALDNSESWPQPDWFESENVMVASNWGYTRAKGGGPLNDDLDRWCEVLEAFGDKCFNTPRVGLADKISSRDHPKGPKMKMQRLASWICFQKLSWVQEMAALFSLQCGSYTLPVPSHDTSLWYAALRSQAPFHFAKMTKWGWANRLTMKSINNEVDKVLERYA